MIRRRTLLAASLAAPALAQTDDYPSRPIRVVVGFAAGGATDITTRALGPVFSAQLGQPVVVENRPGAGGNIATELVVHAPPDGYTLLMGTIGALAINPTLYKSLPFSPQQDLTPISRTVEVTNILVVPVDRPWHSVMDLVAAAKKAPQTVTYASSGVGGAGHLGGALLDSMTAAPMVHVPYRGGGPLITDLLSGKVDFSIATAPTVLPHVEAGKLRALAVPTPTRSSLLPDVPTIAEAGVAGYAAENWYGLLGPKGLPAPIVARLNAAITATLHDPEVVATLKRQGAEPQPSTPEAFGAHIARETEKWAPIVRASGATVE